MKAEKGIKYANIIGGKVAWIFTSNEMSEWNENDLQVVAIPKEYEDSIEVGTPYHDDFQIITKIPTQEGVSYAMLSENNALIYAFSHADRTHYIDGERVVIIPNEQIQEVKEGDVYNHETKQFELDMEYVRSLYIGLANKSYDSVIRVIMGEDTPLSEMISWETQEKEAKAYLESKDIAQAGSIALMAQTQGRDIEEFANKILEKAQKYRVASSFLIGYRQKIIKELENASDIEQIRAAQFNSEYVYSVLNKEE